MKRDILTERERAEAVKNIKQFADQLAQYTITLCEGYDYTAQEVVIGVTYLLNRLRQGLSPELIKQIDESFKIVPRSQTNNLLKDLKTYLD